MPPAEWSPEQQSFADPSQQYPGQAPNNCMGYNPYEAPQGGFQGQDPGYANPYGAPPYDPNAFDPNVPSASTALALTPVNSGGVSRRRPKEVLMSLAYRARSFPTGV
ncbi:uncharacterized protein LOC114828195 [Galendromus occidentalis]|uniref:Uncharacterized protein LOC114828195 n=1 Tax=Galendromus occidentalis TaxID=34638 RepID=A0AAJ7SFT6_9ACAR|nr:uncharacterized protein LOC114828195 [Galendromus occidentalis]